MTSLITPKKGDNTSDLKNHKVVKQKPTTSTIKSNAAGSSKSGTIKWPPASSAKSLPPLSGRISDLLHPTSQHNMNNDNVHNKLKPNAALSARDTIEFEVNQECTSLTLVPSGRIAVAGFSDGTLRLFDLTGLFARDRNDPRNFVSASATDKSQQTKKTKKKNELDELFDDDSSGEESFQVEEEQEMVFGTAEEQQSSSLSPSKKGGRSGSTLVIDSNVNQRYGAVACQIHSRGVHTSLLMDVAISEDGMYAFGGVLRGSVELAAVYLGDVEEYIDRKLEDPNALGSAAVSNSVVSVLDLIQVDRHADAKLRGFGACTRLWNGWDRSKADRPEYLLLSGKGIKNIHIWSYKPSRIEKEEESVWTCLYDTQTNGTSINQLYFRHNALGHLQGISKSDDQKLRVWDLSYEQKRIASDSDGSDRPKRPDYVDVASTEGTIGVCGPYAFASGSLGGMHNIINVVGLDADDVSSPFNCTELALPAGGTDHFVDRRKASRTGRQQRGDLKSIVNVTGLVFDASHALLQLSDSSVVQYRHDESGHPFLVPISQSMCTTFIDDDVAALIDSPPQQHHSKKLSLARVGSEGMVLFAVSSFNESTSRGAIALRALPGSENQINSTSKPRRYWGFNGLKKRNGLSQRVVKPKPIVTHHVNEMRPGAANTMSGKKQVNFSKTPSATKLSSSLKPAMVTCTPKKASNDIELEESPGPMDSQLESIAVNSSQQPFISPKRSSPTIDKETLNNNSSVTIPAKKRRKKTTPTPKNTPNQAIQKEEKLTTKSSSKPTPKPPQKKTSLPLCGKKKVGFVGMTMQQDYVEKPLPELCYQQKERPLLLVEHHPSNTVNSRYENIQSSSNDISRGSREHQHCHERQQLAAKHRAEHEMLRKKVLFSIRHVLSTWDIELSSNKNFSTIVESATKWFDEALLDHEEVLADMLDRQAMEAESLAARQTAELVGKLAPMLRVSFPFPEVFEQAKQELQSTLTN
ncbi:hypothetical protein QTG54_002266 [Skeletonema marinoi]|uniref:Uncharacterized protein n=1 Tax=Skeletonema marinoi TaxID=267567 RepID=A0AAD9DH30_9STRA|nr:hypothetical protein QTG54_002266 [Skeletonema marinoi]